jgi:SAM-dependent methyltransferase
MASEGAPPAALTARYGGTHEDYAAIGSAHVTMLETLLPSDWSWADKRVLDFGCGAGRTLQALAPRAAGAELWGCDIQEDGIAWASGHLPMRFFVNSEEPPLDVPDASFDLVYGMSVFTHIGDGWAAWAAEMHRVLAPGGFGIFTFLGEGMWSELLGRPWDPDRIGLIATQPGRPWTIGGPNVFASVWWLREHWGRAFEVVSVRPAWDLDAMEGHGWLVVRRDERPCSVAELERIDGCDPREVASLQLNVELLAEEGVGLRRSLEARAGELETVLGSRSWRLTAPLRRMGHIARNR